MPAKEKVRKAAFSVLNFILISFYCFLFFLGGGIFLIFCSFILLGFLSVPISCFPGLFPSSEPGPGIGRSNTIKTPVKGSALPRGRVGSACSSRDPVLLSTLFSLLLPFPYLA